jgi:hypothetical protein
MPVAASPFDIPHNPHGTEPREQFLEQHPKLEPRQVGTQTVMHALTET